MLLEARQKAMKASNVRSNSEGENNCWAKTIPTKSARFFVHCFGRSARSRARTLPPVLNAGEAPGGVTAIVCCSVCCSCLTTILSKEKRFPYKQKDCMLPHPNETFSDE